ncbi:MAG: hypothetical protein ACI906_005412 [Candidatus Latescibacterota bacterium]
MKPVTLIEDSAAQLVFWLPLHTPTMKPELLNPTADGPRRWDLGWHLVESVWRTEVLLVIKPDQRRATFVRWTKERAFYGWYINMQSELRRTYLGFDMLDYQLDILVDPDRSWRWKDKDELELAIDLGRMTPAQGEAVEREAQRAIAELENNEGPCADGWENWQPSSDLERPQLAAGWDDLSMYPPV